jgi:Ca2+-binding RTX toxin-like protein
MLNHKLWLAHLKQSLTKQAHALRSRRLRYSRTESLESRQLLAATPVGPEFRVNSTTADNQTTSSMAMDADGDFVVAWQSNLQDGSLYGIYAQRYNAAGVPQGLEFRVNTTTFNQQGFPSVAMDADGDFVVAWSSYGQDGSNEGIYAQRFDAAGVMQGGEFRVNTFTALGQRRPSVAMDADGDFVISWHSNAQDGDSFGIYAQKYNSAGVIQGNEFRVNTTTVNSQSFSSVAMEANGDFVIAWTSTAQDGSGDGIFAQRYNAAGVAQGGEFAVNTFTTSNQSAPSTAIDADGDFVVAWQSYGQDGSVLGIYARRYNMAGVAQGTEFPVNTFTTDAQFSPAVAMDTDGDFVVSWTSYAQDGNDNGVYAQRYNAAGVAQGAEFRVNTETVDIQRNSTVAMDANGNFVIAWESLSQDGSATGIYAQRYDESTTTAGPMVTEVRDLDRQITPGGRLSTTLDTLTVVFSEDLNVVGGASGANSVLNPANWQLTQDGVNVSSLIIGITFEPNIDTGKFEAELTLGAPLSSATYRLTVVDTIRGLTGNALDGDFNGTPGGSYQHSFAIAGVQSVGAEFQVNTETTGIQSRPSMAMDADGDYVVTWQSNSQDGSGYGIYAQRYNAAGVAQDTEFQVNTFTTNGQISPSVAMDADGDFVVSWQSYGQDGSVLGIYARRYNAAGVAQGGEFQVNTFTTNSQSSPSVAMDADGDFVVSWHSYGQDLSGYGIYAQRYNAAGVAQGGEFSVNTFTTNSQRFSSVAMDDDGDFVVTWHSGGQDGNNYGIYAQRYNAAGVAQGGEFPVNTFTTNSQSTPSVAMDADGDFVVTWHSFGQDGNNYGTYAQRYNAAGVAQGGEFRVNTFTNGHQFSSSVAMDADGDFVVSWQSFGQDGNNYGIYAQRYNAAGVPQGGEFRVNTFTSNSQRAPSVAMDADGDFVVAWESNGQDGSGFGVYAQRYQSDAPVQLTIGVLSLSGSNVADEMSVERIEPAGSTAYLNAVRNGVNYTIDATKVTNIVMNGSTGDDRLAIDAALTTPATLNGDGGNDTLIGGAGNDILNGGTGNDLYIFDTDTALGFDIVTDTSGIDTLDFSGTLTNAVALNLSLNTTQVVNANHSLRLATGYSIENVFGGALNDTLTGNLLNNSLTGGSGDDTLTGGAGNDRYLFDVDLVLGADIINEFGGGVDTLDFSATTTRNLAINLANAAVQTVAAGFLTLNLSAGNTIESVIGGSLNDGLTGNSLNNLLVGGPGNDFYGFDTDTPLGSDTINEAGGGIDTLWFGATTTRSIAIDLSNAAAQVVTASNLTLTLSSSFTIENVIGGSLGDTLVGNILANTITGGPGIDMLIGASGDDTYLFDTDAALGSDTINDISGIDTLDFSATTTLGVNVNLANTALQVINAGLSLTLLSASSMENVIGGVLGDTLTGNILANTLTGGPGNDTMTGGAGDDCYKFVANANLGGDTIIESGGGIDTLDFSGTTTQAIAVNLSNAASQVVSPTLSLTLSAGNTIEKIIGGALGDTLTGNTLANVFTGGGGNDTLAGGAGDDIYLFNTDLLLGGDTINESGGGIDTLDFSSTLANAVVVNLGNAAAQTVTAGRLTLTLSANNTIENIVGGALGDTLTGNALMNRITGGGGNDVLTGGAGNDIYVFDTDLALGTDTINEAGGGVDTLTFSPTTTRAVSVDLSNAGPQVVNAGLTLNLSSGSTLESVIGGSLDDTLTGNTLGNVLIGGPGNDLLTGGAGNDVYSFDTDLTLGSDTIIESGGGIDTLNFSQTTTTGVVVDLSTTTSQVVNAGLTLTLSAGNALENAIGGSLDDILIGNTLANTLTGNDGNDVLSGRSGNDILSGGNGRNVLIGGYGADQLTGGTGEDLLLGARSVFEDDADALASLRAEWISASSFDDRVGHLLGTLAGGLHNGFTLTSSTVKEESSADTLIGSSGRDWYLRNSLGTPTIFRDVVTDADLDSVFTEINSWL